MEGEGKTLTLTLKKGDAVAVALVVLLAVALVLVFLPWESSQPAWVEIYHHGQLVKTLPLSENGSYTLSEAYTNVIWVEDSRVSMIESDCPGGDCMHSGSISAAGRSIVCLPNGVEVRIVGRKNDVDFVVG